MTEAILEALQDFYERYRDVGLFSTGSRVVDFEDDLYNVIGSTDDPAVNGKSWKQLLLANGIAGDCYATEPLPDRETSHAQFNVGGHMTPNPDGAVPHGGICYLMPLCKWHNSSSNNGIPFVHTQTRMLELSGYMEGELAATFLARIPGGEDIRIVGVDSDDSTARVLERPQARTPWSLDADRVVVPPELRHYLVFRRVAEGGSTRFIIEDANLR